MFDVASYCFRHESSHEPGRLQSFRMREYVYIGTPEGALAFRKRWIARAAGHGETAGRYPTRLLTAASDPFFGRVGKMMAISQVEQALKFEILIPVEFGRDPTACMSFNYHQDHFGDIGHCGRMRRKSPHGLRRLWARSAGACAIRHTWARPEKWPAIARETLSV